jgi:hypothetical protein
MTHMQEVFRYYFDNREKLDEDVAEATKIDETHLQYEKKTQTERYLYWARLHTIAEYEYDKQDELIKQVVWPNARERPRKQAGPRGTVALIDDLSYSDAEYRQASAMRLELKYIKNELSKVENALYMRKDMIQSLGADQRVELTSLPKDMDEHLETVRKVLRKRANREDRNDA